MAVKNKAQLITYPDSLGGSLQVLNDLLVKHFRDTFPGGVHILPPFPSSGDRGFAPKTYFEIDPQFGTWEDIRQISRSFPVLLDLMVNHISRHSPYFLEFQKRGRRSPYADLFITLDKIWPGGIPRQEDVEKIFLRRPDHPFADVTVEETGQVERVWATFGRRDWSEQIDLDVHSPTTRSFFTEILDFMSSRGVKMLRLDAIGYVIKKPGTSSFFVEPEIYDFLGWFREKAQAVDIELLPEVHAHYTLQSRLAQQGYWVYDFVLPALVLHTFFSRDSRKLADYLKHCPRRQFTTLDVHDGIPILPDVEDVLSVEEMQQVTQLCIERGANISRIFSAGHRGPGGFDVHQINITYYSALGADDDAYLAARAIQCFAPGVPQIYYAGLLAGENTPEEVERSGEKRAINRHNYSKEEVEVAVEKPIVKRLLDLIRFRNEHPAFGGDFDVVQTPPGELQLAWHKKDQRCSLRVDLKTGSAKIHFTDQAGHMRQL